MCSKGVEKKFKKKGDGVKEDKADIHNLWQFYTADLPSYQDSHSAHTQKPQPNT